MTTVSNVLVRGLRRGVLMCAFPAALLCAAGAAAADFNDRGNIVIADQFNNRVIEIDPHTHAIVWQFGNGSDKAGPHSIVGTNDAERFGPLTLIAGTGIPPASPPLPGCSDAVNGDRKSTRLNSSHDQISYAVFCLKKKKKSSRNASSSPHQRSTSRHLVPPCGTA